MIINITILEDNESDFITLSDSIKKWAANTGILINIIWLNSYKKFIKSLPTLKCDLFFSDIELNCNNSFTGIDACKQLTNDYIDNANQEQRLERAEHEQRNRFMGWILFVVVLLFILPTYNLVETYMNIKQQEKEVLSLQKDYDKLSDQTKERKDLAKKLKDDAFAEKYARAKYYYSREGESIYPVPSLLP